MSIKMYQSNIARLDKDIANLERKKSEETQREARLYNEILSINRTITKSTSASMLRMKNQQITSKQDEIGRIKKKVAGIQSSIASKRSELQRNQQYLAKAEEQERKRRQAEDEKRSKEELRSTQQSTSEDRSSLLEILEERDEAELALNKHQTMNSQPRKGGPLPTPDEKKQAIIEGWLAVQGRVSQAAYCHTKGISPSTLRKWMRNS